MADFSTISQAPEIRALVQDNLLERAFHDALFPRLLFRSEAQPQLWPANVGDTMVFTGTGLITPKARPLAPGSDPPPSTYQNEQWDATLQQYADSIDTHMPTSIVAIANLFLRNAQQLGMSAGMTMNRIVRNRMYNAASSGWTVADGTQGSSTTIRVKRLNGLTKARNPNLAAGSNVRFSTVSTNNPLLVNITAIGTTRNIVGFTPDNPGDELGPGTITLDVAIAVTDRDVVATVDRTSMVFVGGGTRTDDIGSGDVLLLANLRTAVARFWSQNVPEMPDGRFHAHMSPTSQTQIFADAEFQRLLTSLPDYYMYKQFAVGEILNTVVLRNSECPVPETVTGGSTATFSLDDPFAPELFSNGNSSTGVRMERPLLCGQGSIFEYYQDLSGLVTEAGVVGKIGTPTINNNGIEIMTERIQLIIRAPLNRLQDLVSTSWKFIGDWPVRTDAAVGDTARFKRIQQILHGS
jgi:hypothetical protein